MPRQRPFVDEYPPWAVPEKRDTAPCVHAEQFLRFADEILATLESATEQLHVNRAKLLLVERYMRLRSILPAAHRDKTARGGHYCVYRAFVESWEQIGKKEELITPPGLALPPPPPRSSRPRKQSPPQPPPDLNDPETIHKLILGA